MPVRYLNLEYWFNWLYQFLASGNLSSSLPSAIGTAVFWIKLISLVITPFLFAGVVILTVKLARLRAQEQANMKGSLFNRHQVSPLKNERWERVLGYLATDNPAEWKLAVIEADNMLDDVVKQLRPVGENLGERLKSVSPSEFLSLDDAWEAHKIRNKIAHESGFVLTKPEARKTIERYGRVFEEFEYI